VQGLVTAGSAVALAALPAAANVAVHRWLPHAAVLPRAALVVTHAGHGTVAKSLAHGIPLLCLPMGRDQGYNAQRVQDLGAGLAVAPDAAPGVLAATITELLRAPGYREAAQRVAAAIRAAGPGAANAAAEVETMVARR
jgi:UDP:flavonoid glycosyltransferase YjiC (YdhE family)